MLKILFVYKQVEYIDPMGIMLLSALAKENGHRTYVNVLSDNNLIDSIKEIKPDVVAYSAKTGEHKYYLDANEKVKRYDKNIFAIMGGPHTTFFPEVVEKAGLDAVCIGEGDDAWPEFLEAFANGGNIHNIPNIVTRENRANNSTPEIRLKRRDLDSLPYLDRDLFYKTTRLGRFPMRSAMASRGCPYKCTYCFNRRYNEIYSGKGKLYNRYGVSRLCAELKNLKERWPTQFIKFYDDVFALRDDEWLIEFAEVYPKEVGLPFHCLVRADTLTEGMLLKLKKAGIQSISMSIEAGNDYVREQILDRGMTREAMIRGFGLCHKHGVYTFSNTILALPVRRDVEKEHNLPDAMGRDIESVDMNIRCRVTFSEFPILFPYPGTKLGQYCIDNGFFDGDYDKLHMSYSTDSPMNCFTEKEKLMQMNLSFLGLLCVMFPRLRNITINWLIRLPLTKLYFLIFYFAKAYLIKTRIYPMKFSLTDFVGNVWYSLSLEWFKRSKEKFHEEENISSGIQVDSVVSGPKAT
ncbi:MAG: radical SAM protein [Candidatus Brocadiales bacterium]|nr:radical SAM protein [Candidatus Brocadiales bacterium]